MDERLTEKNVPIGSGAFQKVRSFSDASIQRSIDDALGRIPKGKRGAFLKGRVDSKGTVAAVAVAKLNDHWSIGVIGEMHKDKSWDVGFETAITF